MGENPEEVKKQIAEAVMGSVEWKIARLELSEKDVWLQVLPNRLLVRHLPNVVRQVERVVLDMKLATQYPRGNLGGGGGGVSVSGGGGGGFF